MAALDRAALLALAQKPPRREPVEVPELGGTVYVRVMTCGEKDAFEETHARQKFKNFRARYIVATVAGEDGSLLFTAADVAAVGNLPIDAVDRIYAAASKINGLSKDDEKTLEQGEPPAE